MGSLLPVFSGASIYQMPVPAPESILVSVAECGKSAAALRRIKKIIKSSGAKKIYLDNGTYTFFKKWQDGKRVIFDSTRPMYPEGIDMNLTSEHVAFYNSILKPYATFCLDLPTPWLPINHDPGEEEFYFSLTVDHNITCAKEMSYLKKKLYPQVNQFFVFQGYNVNQLILIKSRLGDLEFDGYSLPTRCLNWNRMTAMMIMLYHYGVRKIHILAGSNMPAMAICAFMSRHFFDEVSYDSTNWMTYGKNGEIRLFGSMRALATGKPINVQERILNAQCGCPHCNGRSNKDYQKMEYGNNKVQRLIKHNALIEVETVKALYDHSETSDMLRDFLLSHCGSNRTKLILEMNQCLSGINHVKDYLGDFAFARGFAVLIFKQFKT